mgnify:CR=1 FL=1
MKSANGNYIRPTAQYSWWVGKKTYLRYMMRELSSLFIGAFSLIMVWGLYQISQGEAAYISWSQGLWHDLTILSLVIFAFSVYHSFTWFWVTPKAMPIKMAGKRISGAIIIGAHLFLWLICSLFVWLIFICGGGA